MKTKRSGRKAHPFPLKAMLAERGWSQGELARSTKLTIQTINAIANGRQKPSYGTLLLICTTLGVDVSALAVGGAKSATGNGRKAS
jgi:transcriptional regulator with XRE-family HTH domain